MKWSKWATFLIGVIAVVIGFIGKDLTSLPNYNAVIDMAYYDSIIISGFILVPLIIGIMGLKTDKNSFLLFCFGFAFTMGIASLFPTLELDRYIVFFYRHKYRDLLIFYSTLYH